MCNACVWEREGWPVKIKSGETSAFGKTTRQCPICGANDPLHFWHEGLERLLDDLDSFPPTTRERIHAYLRRWGWRWLYALGVVAGWIAGKYYPIHWRGFVL